MEAKIKNRMRKAVSEDVVMVATRISVETVDDLNEICIRNCINRGALIRQLIENYVRENKNRR